MPRKKEAPLVNGRPEGFDAAALIQKDRSGPPRNAYRSEGKDNFAAITAEAQKAILPDANEVEVA